VVWAPAGADFLCVEPQSHAIGAPSEAIVRALTPLKRLESGETLEGWVQDRRRRSEASVSDSASAVRSRT
jgi:galactose mutarotase-like enzyme